MAKKLLAGYDLAGGKITGSADPVDDSDLVTKSFLTSELASVGGGGAGIDPVFPIGGYGLVAASDDPIAFFGNSSIDAGQLVGARVWIPANTPVSMLWVAVRNAGTYATSTTPNQIGIYSDSGDLIATTPDDSTLWTAAGWRGGSLPSTVAAQATGRFVYILALAGGMTGVTIPYASNADDGSKIWFASPAVGTHRRSFYAFESALPASFDPATYGTDTSWLALLGAS